MTLPKRATLFNSIQKLLQTYVKHPENPAPSTHRTFSALQRTSLSDCRDNRTNSYQRRCNPCLYGLSRCCALDTADCNDLATLPRSAIVITLPSAWGGNPCARAILAVEPPALRPARGRFRDYALRQRYGRRLPRGTDLGGATCALFQSHSTDRT